jgi:cytochrome c oxidase subunit II
MIIDTASDIAREVNLAFLIIGGICTVLFICIVVVMLTFIFRYHHSKRRKTSQRSENHLLEVVWIVIPTLIVTYMFFVGFRGFKQMRQVPDDHMVIKVVAKQWSWSFFYPAEGIYLVNDIHIPAGQPVKFELSAPLGDVVHSFYIPAFRIKEDCVPGLATYCWVKADQPEEESATYNLFCAEYCGAEHAAMIGSVTVDRKETYDKWLKDQQSLQNRKVNVYRAMSRNSLEIKIRDGEGLYRRHCLSCHGSSGRGEAETSVLGARDLTTLDGWYQGTRLVDLYRTISDGVPGSSMLSMEIVPVWDRFAIMHYAAGLYRGDDRPKSSLDDFKAITDNLSAGQ